MGTSNAEAVDYLLFVVVNAVIILTFLNFISRVEWPHLERRFGMGVVLMGIPAAAVAIMYALDGRDWWQWAVPAVFVIWTMVEFVVDVILKMEFRQAKDFRILFPFFLVFYLSIVGMWMITWDMGRAYWGLTAGFLALHISGLVYAYSRGRGGGPAR